MNCPGQSLGHIAPHSKFLHPHSLAQRIHASRDNNSLIPNVFDQHCYSTTKRERVRCASNSEEFLKESGAANVLKRFAVSINLMRSQLMTIISFSFIEYVHRPHKKNPLNVDIFYLIYLMFFFFFFYLIIYILKFIFFCLLN